MALDQQEYKMPKETKEVEKLHNYEVGDRLLQLFTTKKVEYGPLRETTYVVNVREVRVTKVRPRSFWVTGAKRYPFSGWLVPPHKMHKYQRLDDGHEGILVARKFREAYREMSRRLGELRRIEHVDVRGEAIPILYKCTEELESLFSSSAKVEGQ